MGAGTLPSRYFLESLTEVPIGPVFLLPHALLSHLYLRQAYEFYIPHHKNTHRHVVPVVCRSSPLADEKKCSSIIMVSLTNADGSKRTIEESRAVSHECVGVCACRFIDCDAIDTRQAGRYTSD